jgi:hypothetical protein
MELRENVPGRSFTQWRLKHETTASCEFLGIVAKRFSSSPTILSTSAEIRSRTFRCETRRGRVEYLQTLRQDHDAKGSLCIPEKSVHNEEEEPTYYSNQT